MNRISGSRKCGKRYYPGILFFAAFTIYLETMCPTVYWLDSGEFTAALPSLGLAHSPSFPSFILSSAWIQSVPLGDLAYRSNLISVLFGASVIVLFYLLLNRLVAVREKSIRPVLAFVFSLWTLFNPIFWFQCLKVEVYSLNLMLQLLFFWVAEPLVSKTGLPVRERDVRIVISFFIYCLGLGNHLLLMAHISVLIIWIVFRYGACMSRKIWVLVLLTSGLASSIYIYLPIRSAVNPPIDLGNPERIGNFINCLTRRGSFERFFGNTLMEWFHNIFTYFEILKDMFPASITLLVLVISTAWMLVNRSRGLFFLLAAVSNIVITLLNRNFNENPDTGPAYLMLSTCVWMLSLSWLFIELVMIRPKEIVWKWIHHFVFGAVGIALIWIVAGWIGNGFTRVSLKNDFSARRIGASILENCAPDSVIFTGFYTNLRFVFESLKICDSLRGDVEVIDRGEVVYWPGGLEKIWQNKNRIARESLTGIDPEKFAYLVPLGIRHNSLIPREEAMQIVLQFLSNLAHEMKRDKTVYWFPSEDDVLLGKRIRAEGLLIRLLRDNEEVNQGPDPAVWMRYVARSQMLEPSFHISSGSKIVCDSLVNLANTMDNAGAVATAYIIYQSALIIDPESSSARYNFDLLRKKLAKDPVE